MKTDLKKINIVGTSGSGKSTFAKKLANILSIDYIEMDVLFWRKNWHCLNDKDFSSLLKTSLEKERWVLDGNYSNTTPVKWENVDVVIWLDFSFFRTMSQAVKRAVIRIHAKKELWPGTGNKETFRKTFLSKHSILLWTLKTYKKNKIYYESIMSAKEFSHIIFIRLASPKACSEYLNHIENDAKSYLNKGVQ